MKSSSRQKKLMIILVLFVAVIGLSVGFAAFSTSLLISSSATVTPSASDFSVKFSSSSTSLATSAITPTVSGATGANATIDNSGTNPKITGLAATFTNTGQTVTYTFYARNTGAYTAYLKSVTFGTKTCTKIDSTATDSLVTAACADITLSVKVGSSSAYTSTSSVSSHSLAAGSSETVVVTITYASSGDKADGDFSIAFGDVTLAYKSVDA